jgi:putative ATP-grasp target RiPP
MTSPFALLAERPPLVTDRTPAFTYDRARQLNVASCGTPVIDVARHELANETITTNSSGTKKDDDWVAPPPAKSMLFGPSYTVNSSGTTKDDD